MTQENNNLKSTTDEIRERFDHDVERFANLSTGQQATMDAPIAMELITQAAVATTYPIQRVLDIGCGAGNNTLKLLQSAGPFDCDLVDLSLPMLDRAKQRVEKINSGHVNIIQGDFRDVGFNGPYDVILAAAVLHHLRDDKDWESAFTKIYNLTAENGSVWITDLVDQETAAARSVMRKRYGNDLTTLRNEAYRDEVFSYIEREDFPRPVTYQIELLRKVGFKRVELLHKNGPFAAFGAFKPADK